MQSLPGPRPSPAQDASSQSAEMLGRGSLYTLATAAPLLSGAAFTPFTTRILGVREYGVAAACIVVTQIAALVLPLGIPAAVTRHVILERSGPAGGRSLLLRGLGLSLGLAVALAMTSRVWAPAFLDHGWRMAVVWASFAGAALGGVTLAQAYLRGVDRVAPFTAVAVTASLAGQGLGLSAAIIGRSADAYLLGLMTGYGLAATVGAVVSLRDGPQAKRSRELPGALRIGLPTVPHQVASYLASGALVIVAAHQAGAVGSARLQVALLVGSVPSLLVTSMNNAWAPAIYRSQGEARGVLLEQSAVHLGWLMAVCSIGVGAVSPWALMVVAPRGFQPEGLLLPTALAAWVGTLAVAYLASVHLVFAEGRSTALAWTTPMSLMLAVGVAVVAGRQWSLTGVAMGLPVFYLSQAGLVRALSIRVSPTRWSFRRVIPPVAVGGVITIATAALPVLGPGVPLRAATLLGAAGTLLVLGRRIWRR